VTITKHKQQMQPLSPETTNSLLQEGKKIFIGQIGMPVGTSIKSIRLEEPFGKGIIGGQITESPAAVEEARVLTHPEVVKAFDEAADAIDAWEKSL
jgi:hypothetical protein